MKEIIIFLFIVFCLINSANAEDTDNASIFVEANSAYDRQDFEKAVELYNILLEQNPQNGHLLFNIGNAFYRLDKLGKAIGYYLKAMQHIPRDEDLSANLEYARKRSVDEKEETSIWSNLSNEWIKRLSLKEWLRLVIIANFLFWLFAGIRLFWKREFLSWLIGSFGMIAVIFMIGFVCRLNVDSVGVIISREAAIFSAPNPEATVLFQLHEGSEVVIEEQISEWIKIEYSSKKKGWVPQDSIFPVNI